MPPITLTRTGDRPLTFEGEQIATASSGNHDATRWHELALYRTATRYVLAIAYRTRWEGELGRDDVTVEPDDACVANRLRAYDAAAHVLGYPPGEAYREKQLRMLRQMYARYEDAATRLLATLPAERLEPQVAR